MSRRTELFRALGALCETPHPAHAPIARALGLQGPADPSEYTDAFVFQLPPYASIYLGAEGMLGGEARGRIAGFWQAAGFTPPPEPDHLAALLSLYAALEEAEDRDSEPARRLLRREAKVALLWEHLLPWAPQYASKMMQQTAPGHFAQWAGLLSQVLLTEAALLGGHRELPVHLRSAPPPGKTDASLEELVGALLSPVRSGLLVTRHDLAGAASDNKLGLRMGERRFALTAMLDQDPVAVLAWLVLFARAWAVRHREMEGDVGVIAAYWADRAEATADSMAETLATSGRVARRG
ncbi:MAG: molecular chaperone TorD family protein [Actinomycetota bacterium]|nr:molecular chaperone TorD family protein [Actinomycetota bacterium]